MSMTDPIADFLTRIRNAIHAAHETVEIPASKLKAEVARILTEQGYIESWSVVPAPDGGAGQLIEIRLKYTDDRRSAISGLRRVSADALTWRPSASPRCSAGWELRSCPPRAA
jgi:small subunit ribosomal protein S8